MRAIITLTGPSGAGKSTVIRELVRIGGSVLSPVVIPKYTTRPPRDEDLVRSPELREVISVSTLPSECDLVYEQYGDRYGLAFADLYRALRRGQSPIVILNDVRAVEDVRSALGKIVHSLFVFRETPMLDKYERLASERGVTNRSEPWTRFQKALGIYRIYIENIQLFDHVILNCGDERDLTFQVEQFVVGVAHQGDYWPLRERAR